MSDLTVDLGAAVPVAMTATDWVVAEAAPSEVVGIDVSRWQGVMNWDVAKPKIQFAFIKASQGQTGRDAQFERNWLGTKERGIPRGAYHYFSPRRSPVSDPKLQAQNFAAALGEDTGDLPPMLDCESDNDDLNLQEMQDRIYKFLKEFTSLTGRECGIYTRKYWWDPQVTNGTKSNTDFPRISGNGMRWLWVAHYNSTVNAPLIPWDWEKRYGLNAWTFWQWSADGNGKGAEYGAESKAIDLNRYNGTLEGFMSEFDLENVEPGPEPEPEPEPQPGGLVMRVNTDVLNVRNGPSVENAIDGKLYKGETVVVGNVRGSDAWVEIAPGQWCAAQYNTRVYLLKVEE